METHIAVTILHICNQVRTVLPQQYGISYTTNTTLTNLIIVIVYKILKYKGIHSCRNFISRTLIFVRRSTGHIISISIVSRKCIIAVIIHNIAVGTFLKFYAIISDQIEWGCFRPFSCRGNCTRQRPTFYRRPLSIQEILHVCKLILSRQKYASAYGRFPIGIVCNGFGGRNRTPSHWVIMGVFLPLLRHPIRAVKRPLNLKIKLSILFFRFICRTGLHHMGICGNAYVIQKAADRKICQFFRIRHWRVQIVFFKGYNVYPFITAIRIQCLIDGHLNKRLYHDAGGIDRVSISFSCRPCLVSRKIFQFGSKSTIHFRNTVCKGYCQNSFIRECLRNHHERVSFFVLIQHNVGVGHQVISVPTQFYVFIIVYAETAIGVVAIGNPVSRSYLTSCFSMHSGNRYAGDFSGKHVFTRLYGDSGQRMLELQMYRTFLDISCAVSSTICDGIQKVLLLGHVLRNSVGQRGNTGSIRFGMYDGVAVCVVRRP